MPTDSLENTYTGVLTEDDAQTPDGGLKHDIQRLAQRSDLAHRYIWPNIIVFSGAHLLALYGLTQLGTVRWQTLVFSLALYAMSVLGITAGVHRLWSHRAYKARWPLRALLVLFATVAHQRSIIHWAREHRVHHRYSETNADPVNASRGFFFAHIGWLFVRKHPDVVRKGLEVDCSDMYADPMLAFQHREYAALVAAVSVVGPMLVPAICWDETIANGLCVAVMLRWVCSLHAIWLVNSAAHLIGRRPYDANIRPTENALVSLVMLGEGFHNFHHAFPWDYKTSEWGNALNFTKVFIDGCARIGLAYDLKTVSPEMVKRRMRRTGDGTVNVWGWGDERQDPAEKEMVEMSMRKSD